MLAVLATVLVGASDKQYRPATYLTDTITNFCQWDCQVLFPDHFWFCFNVDGRVLIGQTIAWHWQYDPTKMYAERGQTVQLRYDKDHLWVRRSDGGELQLNQDYKLKGFANGCRRIANGELPSPPH
jgi:hypothetical protein